MASGPITSWQIDGETVEMMVDFNLRGLQNHSMQKPLQYCKIISLQLIKINGKKQKQNHCMVTAAMKLKDACSLEEKLWTNLDSMLKSRDIILPTKVHLVKAMAFSVFMHGCESWSIKKTEHRRLDAFELWCWRRLLGVPWTARRSNQSILKEISPEYSLEGLMLKLKLQYFGTWWEELTRLKRPWCWERLKAGGEGDDREWDGWTASLTPWTWVWVNSRSWWRTGRPGVLQSMGLQRVGHDWATELNWNLRNGSRKIEINKTRFA